MQLNSYVKTDTNKWLLISESHDDSNRCTSCRGKPDQHDTYAFHASARTPGVRFLRVVPIHGNLSWVIDRVKQGHDSWENKAPDTIHNMLADQSAGLYPVSLPSQPWSSGGKAKHLSMADY
jgi:hypothetical protein